MAGDLQRIVSAVKADVNGTEYAIVPGSVTYKDGKPERSVMAADNGDVFFSENFETRKGMLKFEWFATVENLDSSRKIEEGTAVTVKIFNEVGFERVMKSGVSLNDAEKSLGSDGKGEFTFEGSPLE